MNDKIEKLRAEISDLEKKKEELLDELYRKNDELAQELSPFTVGDIVSFKYGLNSKRKGIIERIIKLYADSVYYKIRHLKKDGTIGVKISDVYTSDNLQKEDEV